MLTKSDFIQKKKKKKEKKARSFRKAAHNFSTKILSYVMNNWAQKIDIFRVKFFCQLFVFSTCSAFHQGGSVLILTSAVTL